MMPHHDDGFHAFADESFTSTTASPSIYLMAGLILDPSTVDAVRSEITALKLPREKKIHWHGDSNERHDRVISTIAAIPVEGIVLTRIGPTGERDERRRRKTLEPFIQELEQAGCTHLTLESRGLKADHRDRALLDALRAQHLSRTVRLHHQPGPVEPLLAIPDAICGAYNAARNGNPRWWDQLNHAIHQIEINDL